ncbi:MAG TPA: sigma-70 family RNA polymerase sigma factor [Planctomycetaceae bacterium]|nr:sigma-70 family RNA polymerase sigma factor [Planctomycetaceae bacterium]
MSLSDIDSQLLEHCLAGSPRAWKNFVDRFLGLVVHVTHHTAQHRSIRLQDDVRDDLVSEVFSVIVADKYAALRRFQRNCSLATYLSVIARRVIVRRLFAMQSQASQLSNQLDRLPQTDRDMTRLDDADEVNQLMLRLDPQEAQVVRMYHLEGMSYEQIGQAIGLSENSVGPMLTRARTKMRQQQ